MYLLSTTLFVNYSLKLEILSNLQHRGTIRILESLGSKTPHLQLILSTYYCPIVGGSKQSHVLSL
jgi:hypothetical protein